MNLEGWVKMHRKMLDNPIVFKDADHVAVWTYLLLNATHKEYPAIFKGNKIILSPGQLITGRKAIADKLHISESKVQRILKWFENDQQIEQQTSNKNRLITVVNWSVYQDIEQENKQCLSGNQPTNKRQMDTNKNVKNVKNDKNKYNVSFEKVWEIYPRKADKAAAYKAYTARIKEGYSEDQLLNAAAAYSSKCKREQTEERYIKHGKTFFGVNKPFEDYLKEDGECNEKETAQTYRKPASDYYREYYT